MADPNNMAMVRFNPWRNARMVRYAPGSSTGQQRHAHFQNAPEVGNHRDPDFNNHNVDGQYLHRIRYTGAEFRQLDYDRQRRAAQEQQKMDNAYREIYEEQDRMDHLIRLREEQQAQDRLDNMARAKNNAIVRDQIEAFETVVMNTAERDRQILTAAARETQQPQWQLKRGFMPKTPLTLPP